MPDMKISDLGDPVPKNAGKIVQYINNAILYHEESVFWDDNPEATERWEREIIERYLSGDRSGDLADAPDPIY